MAPSREQVVREVFERFNARDFEWLKEFAHPEVEIVSQTSRLAGVPYRGYDGISRWIEETFESFDEWTLELDEVEERTPGRVLAVGSVHMRGRESGAAVDMPCGWIFDFEEALCTRFETFPNRVEEARSVAAA